MKKIVLCLFAACSLTGCSKETSTFKNSDIQNSVARTDTWESLCDIPNSSNPYDFVGSEHNRIMAKCDEAKYDGMSLSDVYNVTDRILMEEELISEPETEEFASPGIRSFESEASLRSYINSVTRTDIAKTEINNLVTITLQYDGTNLCETISEIKKFEEGLLEKYSSSAVAGVLAASSVSRYSLAYWHEREVAGAGDAVPTGWFRDFIVGLADAIGAHTGYERAGWIGAISGAIEYSSTADAYF
ncbi:MAG TPA: hypothetical protein VL092_10755 [Chitinophagaceae bacterium]|nr:hypothetical protein [Chitinophagaceae bacterium]